MRRVFAALLLCAPLACAGFGGSRDLDVSSGPPHDDRKAASRAPSDADPQWHLGPSDSGVAVELRF